VLNPSPAALDPTDVKGSSIPPVVALWPLLLHVGVGVSLVSIFVAMVVGGFTFGCLGVFLIFARAWMNVGEVDFVGLR